MFSCVCVFYYLFIYVFIYLFIYYFILFYFIFNLVFAVADDHSTGSDRSVGAASGLFPSFNYVSSIFHRL